MEVEKRTQTEPEMIMETETTESAEAASCPYNLRKRRQIVMKEGEDDGEDQEDSPSQRKVNLVRRIPWTILTLLTMVQLATANKSYTQEHQLNCIDGGVQLIQNSSYPYDVCTENYCVSFISPRTVESVKFPPQVTLHDYLVKWKIRDGDKTDIMETLCRATAFCPSIECTFCEANIANPECWPRAALIGVGLLLYVSFMICYVIFAVPVVLGRPLLNVIRWIGLLAKVGVKNLFKCSKAMLGCIFTRMRRRRRRRIWSEIAIIITTMAIAVNGCQEVSVFHQHLDLCLRSSSRETCTVDTTEVVKINPFRREACLRLTANDSAITEIRILWKELQLFCEKETVLYTRSTRYATLDSKRCPHVGSCTGDKCASVNRSTLLHELEQANQYPGVTGCTESCGGLGCDCFYPSSGCLFYRIYLIPEDHRIYEFYRCARWKPAAELLVTMSGTKASTQALRLRVSPNEPKQFSWWTLTLSSLGFPPVPALDSTFVTNGIHTAIAPRHYQPPLVCQTPKDARSMTCEVVEDCICTPAEIKIRCSCKGINLTSHMQHPDHRLPQLRPNVELREDRDQLLARIPHLPTAEFVLRVRGTFHTTSLVSDAVCTVDNTHCSGCYKCAKGAQATVICRSSTEKENAEIRCGDHFFTIPCTINGTRSKLRFYSDFARFHVKCTVHCGKARHPFVITGVLHYTGSIAMAVTRLINGESEIFSEVNFPDVSHIIRVFLQWTGSLLLTIGLVAIALLLTYMCVANSLFLMLLRVVFRFITLLTSAVFRLVAILACKSLRLFYRRQPLSKLEEKQL
ncbi:Integrase catalytic domain-containing protein [Trichostrongylus colubriformis]|uniref:Integrase catalytic domain-containing protein n=1 Tax=Trichostrongylus colubriformis TaxID=6319 RepID=A0AAN8F8D8_TRICO